MNENLYFFGALLFRVRNSTHGLLHILGHLIAEISGSSIATRLDLCTGSAAVDACNLPFVYTQTLLAFVQAKATKN